MGETERSLKARFEEHRCPSSNSSEDSRQSHVFILCLGHLVHSYYCQTYMYMYSELLPLGLDCVWGYKTGIYMY